MGYYRTRRAYQMSDHLPMWIELKTDFGEEYLKERTWGRRDDGDLDPSGL